MFLVLVILIPVLELHLLFLLILMRALVLCSVGLALHFCSLNCLNRKNGILMVLVLLLLLSLILFGLVWMVRELSEVKSLILKCLRL